MLTVVLILAALVVLVLTDDAAAFSGPGRAQRTPSAGAAETMGATRPSSGAPRSAPRSRRVWRTVRRRTRRLGIILRRLGLPVRA